MTDIKITEHLKDNTSNGGPAVVDDDENDPIVAGPGEINVSSYMSGGNGSNPLPGADAKIQSSVQKSLAASAAAKPTPAVATPLTAQEEKEKRREELKAKLREKIGKDKTKRLG